MTTALLGAVVASYLLGAIPTSHWVAHGLKGIDLRTVGSGNLGATNLYRQLGWRYALPVGIFDMMKGAIPVAVIGPWAGAGAIGSLLLGVVAVFGHVFSLFVGFKGGKGVATGLGVFIALAPLPTLIAGGVFVVIYLVFRIASVGSLVATTVMPFAMWALGAPRPTMVLAVILWAFIVYKHRGNIGRLRRREETKV